MQFHQGDARIPFLQQGVGKGQVCCALADDAVVSRQGVQAWQLIRNSLFLRKIYLEVFWALSLRRDFFVKFNK